MIRETIDYTTEAQWLELRKQDLTSTDVAALFNASPYCTYFELWQRKKNNTSVEFIASERMKWGNRLESAIARGLGEDLGIEVNPFKSYMRVPEKRLGSSFDFLTSNDEILEIKNVDRMIFKNDWIFEDEELEAPPHIEFQVQAQLYVSGKESTILAALVGGNELYHCKRPSSDKIFRAIEDKAKIFWNSIDANEVPEIDWTRDSEFIISLMQSSNPNSVISATPQIQELAEEYKRCSENIKFYESLKETSKAQLLMAIGDAEKCVGESFSISAKTSAATEIKAFTRKAFRNFRVNFKGDKTNV